MFFQCALGEIPVLTTAFNIFMNYELTLKPNVIWCSECHIVLNVILC